MIFRCLLDCRGNLLVILNANQLVLQRLTQHISNFDRKIGQFAKG